MAIQRLNNNNHLWWPAFVTDVSAVLALAVAMAFNGCTFIEITKEIDRRLSADAAQAQGLRHRFHNCMLQLQNVPTAPVPGTALLTAVAGLDAAGAASAAGLALVTTSGAGAEESFPSFGEPDVLEYQPDHGAEEPQMCLRLREDARQRLQAAIQLAEAQDPVVADPNVLRCAKELVCLKEPTIECLRGITVVLHCRPHKLRAVLRTGRHSRGFKQCGPAQNWASTVSYALITTPFGQSNLHDPDKPSPFVGPKDYQRAKTYNSVVLEMLRTQYISCDSDTWPPPWRDVLRLRTCDQTAPPSSGSQSYVYLFEVFAGQIRVLKCSIGNRRIITAEHIEQGGSHPEATAGTMAAAFPTAAATSTPRASVTTTIDEEEQASREMQDEDADVRKDMLAQEDVFIQELQLGEDDAGWNAAAVRRCVFFLFCSQIFR